MRRARTLFAAFCGLAAATLAVREILRPQTAWSRRINSHGRIDHGSLESLGYDWSRIADPAQPAQPPLRLYLPQTTDDVARILREAHRLGIRVIPRGAGHSSNNLTFGESILLTARMNGVVELDEERLTATVQPGIISAALDEFLATRGLGLPVLGDHNHITVAGFASVGGMGVTSHRFGLFVDSVERVEYVTWEGEVRTCSRAERAPELYRLLCGTGRFGIITALTVRIIRVDKHAARFEHRRTRYRDLDEFIAATDEYKLDYGNAARIRGVWFDYPLPGGRNLVSGQVATWSETGKTPWKTLVNRLGYGSRHLVGFLAGKLPRPLAPVMKLAGSAAYIYPPRYASLKNLEEYLDKVQDYSVGDPNRWLIIWVRPAAYASLLMAAYELLRDYRERMGCISFINIDYRPFISEYLAHEEDDRRFVELIYYVGIKKEVMTSDLMAEIVSRLDDLCIEFGAYRYMQSLTVSDPERRAKIDPNTYWANKVRDQATPAAN